MKAFKLWYKQRPAHRFYTWAGICLLAAVIGMQAGKTFRPAQAETLLNSTHNAAFTDQGQFDAYAFCCDIATDKYGRATHSFVEGIEMGPGHWLIRGKSDLPDRSVSWTGDVKYDAVIDKWSLMAWTQQ